MTFVIILARIASYIVKILVATQIREFGLNDNMFTLLVKLLAQKARPGNTHNGSGNEAENCLSISATHQSQIS